MQYKQLTFVTQLNRNIVNTEKEMRELALSEAHVLSKKPQRGPNPSETHPAAGSPRRRAPDGLLPLYRINRCGIGDTLCKCSFKNYIPLYNAKNGNDH